jgi:glucuronoarabinoxylan endo-1,4-beta-xylanase
VDNKVCGVIYDTSGNPAGNAKVVLRSSNYILHAGQLGKRNAEGSHFVRSTRTDSCGKFRFTAHDSIPAGEYSVEARDSIGNCVLIQDIQVDSSLLKSDTALEISSPRYDTKLKPPSTIKGAVASLGDSVSGAVFILGLDNYARIDGSGCFVLENVPAGNLRLKIIILENGMTRNDTVLVTTPPADTITVSGFFDAAAIEVDATRTFQTIDGFGASNAWINGRITAELAAVFWKDDTLDGHIGLSLLRTRIDPDGFTNADAGSMQNAIQVNPDILIWGSSWTPPPRFKDNNALTGGHFNSDSASMQGFADHLVKYVQDAKKKTGIDLYAVSCQNEPDSVVETVEGCSWTGEQFRAFLKNYWGPACEKAGISAKRMIGESVKNDLAVTDPSLSDTAAANYADIIGTHLYVGGPSPYPLAESLHKRYWVTEMSGLHGVDTSIADGVRWAANIHDCLVRCNMNAYHYWWLVNKNDGDDEGLCNSDGTPTPRMYALGNFSKFIRPGFVRVAATDSPAAGVKASAFYGRSLNRLVIVAINGGAQMNFDITIPAISEGREAVPWLTDSTHRLERQLPVPLANKGFSYIMPSRSVATFVLQGVAIVSN